MEFNMTGSFTLKAGSRTLAGNMANLDQAIPVPEGYDVAIVEDLSKKGVKFIDRVLFIPQKTVVLIIQNDNFKRIEVVSLKGEEAKFFALSIQSDPDVLAMIEKLNEFIRKNVHVFLDKSEKVVDALPNNGYIENIIIALDGMNWYGALAELLKAIKTALPEDWEAISSKVNPNAIKAFGL